MTDVAQIIPCSGCGTPIDPAHALYGDVGQVCDSCSASAEMADRIVKSCRNLAFSALGTAAASWVFNPFLVLTAGAVVTAVLAIKPYFGGDEEDRATLKRHPLALFVGIGALVVAGIPYALALLPE